MDWYDIDGFYTELETIRSFLFEALAIKDDLRVRGLRLLRRVDGFEVALSGLKDLERNLYKIEKVS